MMTEKGVKRKGQRGKVSKHSQQNSLVLWHFEKQQKARKKKLTLGHSREGHSGKERGDKEQSNRLVEADLAHTGAVLQSREQGTDHQGKDDMDHGRGLENGRMAGQVGQAALGE